MKAFSLFGVSTFIFIIFLSIMPPIRHLYPCIESCGRGSHSQRGLSLHQAKCQAFKSEQQATLQRISHEVQALKELSECPPLLETVSSPHAVASSSTVQSSMTVCVYHFLSPFT